MPKQVRTSLHPRHKMSLDSLRGVCGEQARLYRLWVNGRIKSAEMTRGIFGLREIRCSLEAEAAAQAAAEARMPASMEVIIRSVPSTFVVADENDPDGRIRPQLYIDHEPAEKIEAIEATEPEPSIEAPREPELVAMPALYEPLPILDGS